MMRAAGSANTRPSSGASGMPSPPQIGQKVLTCLNTALWGLVLTWRRSQALGLAVRGQQTLREVEPLFDLRQAVLQGFDRLP